MHKSERGLRLGWMPHLRGVWRLAALGVHRNLVRHKEPGVETHTELANQRHIRLTLEMKHEQRERRSNKIRITLIVVQQQ